jgi:hypothetical protein
MTVNSVFLRCGQYPHTSTLSLKCNYSRPTYLFGQAVRILQSLGLDLKLICTFFICCVLCIFTIYVEQTNNYAQIHKAIFTLTLSLHISMDMPSSSADTKCYSYQSTKKCKFFLHLHFSMLWYLWHSVSPEDDGTSIETCRDNVSVNITLWILCIIVGLF